MSSFVRQPAGILLLLLPALLTVGCRTYGGHGSEEAMLAQIEAAYEVFGRELSQAKNDLRTLQSTAAADPAYADAARQLETVVLAHEAVLSKHAERVEAAREHPGAYRFLHRTFGGMLSEQEMVSRQYRIIRDDLHAALDTSFNSRTASVIPRYHVVPPYFERLRNESYIRPAGSVGPLVSEPTGASPAPDTTAADTSASN